MSVIEGTNIIPGARVRPASSAHVPGQGSYGPFTVNAAPVNGASGTEVGTAAPGALLIRTDAGQIRLYQNTNTLASPTWTAVGTQV